MPRRRTLRRRAVDNSLEKLIITGMIISNKFMSSIRNSIDHRLFKMELGSLVAKWCTSFYDENNEAPGDAIQDIYETEKETLDPAVNRLTETFLADLSERFENQRSFNADYILNKAKTYFSDRAIEVLAEDMGRLARAGKHDRARQVLDSHQTVIAADTAKAVDVFDPKVIARVISPDYDEDVLFKPDETNPLGKLYGSFKRCWLVAIMAPMKRGKTWHLDWLAKEAMWSSLFVYKASLEMPEVQHLQRVYKMLTGLSEESEMITIPTFDCINNQDGTCRLSQRTNDVKLSIGVDDETGELLLPEFKPRMRYKPCEACREDSTDNFIPATWFTTMRTKKRNISKVRKHANQFKVHNGGRLHAASFLFDAELSTIRKDILRIIDEENRVPDVVIIDYADIIQTSSQEYYGMSERGKIDLVWKSLKRLSGEFNCLVLTATQGNRKSFDMDSINERNVSEDIRKLAHCDAMYTLNQTVSERDRGSLRVGMLVHRHTRIIEREVITLQALEVGNPVLDSEWVY